MDQQATLREFDADIMDAMVSAGFANGVLVTVPNGSPVPCDAYIDRTRQESGDKTQVSEPYVQVTLMRSQISAAPQDTVIVVVETGETFSVEKVIPGDESMLVCVVVET